MLCILHHSHFLPASSDPCLWFCLILFLPVHDWLLTGLVLFRPVQAITAAVRYICNCVCALKIAFQPFSSSFGPYILCIPLFCYVPQTLEGGGINVLFTYEHSIIIYSKHSEQLKSPHTPPFTAKRRLSDLFTGCTLPDMIFFLSSRLQIQ